MKTKIKIQSNSMKYYEILENNKNNIKKISTKINKKIKLKSNKKIKKI